MKVRWEYFGGIVCTEKPDLIVFVDKDYMKELGYEQSSLRNDTDYLTAPLNVHFNLTNRCTKQCDYCYSESIKEQDEEISTSEVKEIIDILSEMNVFSVAFGGGEPFLRNDIFEIAKYTRNKNIIPTITTNGLHINADNVKDCRIFNRIHISVNLTEENSGNRQWHKAILLLKEVGVNVGINYIVDKKGYEYLEDICYYGNKYNVRDIMFLRFKPLGRAKNLYNKNRLSEEENINFFPLMKRLSKKYKIKSMVTCSFFPMICWHNPDKKVLEFWGAQGCQGGNYIGAIDHYGLLRCCSFCKDFAGKAREIKYLWDNSPHFGLFRDWVKNAPPPCNSCDYLELCGGGCHCVAEVLTGDILAPDPECPFVTRQKKEQLMPSTSFIREKNVQTANLPH
jgi:radical SAM protein with 4Fe4S-binding SPASM domain